MPNIIEIHDPSAPELDAFARLTEAQLRNRRHPEQGIFIAESAKVILSALDAGVAPVALLMERRQIEGPGRAVLDRCGDVPVYTADRAVLSAITGYELTRGFLCAMRRPAPADVQTLCASAKRVAVLEGIVDPTNVGAIFRSAAALGMDAVLVTPTCCDPLHRRAARVSMGCVFRIPWARIGEASADWPSPGAQRLRELGFKLVSLALSDDSVDIDNPCLTAEPRLAIILGTEGDGLAPATVATSDYTARIPMMRGVDSLNVAAASAVAFWQLARSV